MKSKTAVVLKGGLVKGFGNIGVIRFLTEEDLQPDIIVGASSGAQVAAMHAMGIGWEEMQTITSRYRMTHTGSWRHLMLTGTYFPPKNIRQHFLNYSRQQEYDFSDLLVKLGFIATNLRTQQQEIIMHGNVIDALLASNAFPGVIHKQKIMQEYYRDGDLADQFLVTRLRNLGYSRIIGVSRKLDPTAQGRWAKIYNRFTSGWIDSSWERDRDKLDLYIEYDASDVGVVGFEQIPQLVERCYLACQQKAVQFRKFFSECAPTPD